MLEIKDLAQIAGGIVAYSIVSQTFNFVLRIRSNGHAKGNADFVVESLKEIKTKLDSIDRGIGKIRGKQHGQKTYD